MALTVSTDIGIMGNFKFQEALARGYKYMVGRLTGTYGGALTTMTISGLTPMFVSIPPVSGFVFDYAVSTQMFALRSGSVSLTATYAIGYLASGSTTLDLASFACQWGGEATTGLVFVAFGY